MNNAGIGQMTTTFITFALIWIPFIILNYKIAKRKTDNPVKYLLLSLIPFVNYIISIYLISLPDLEMKKKIDKIYEKILNEVD